ncbi:MAG TPA: hypothetical protein EYF95_03335 [Flavobacteriales bacterium]|nr:hypothetical protein [Flavobacteriales bacterium]
MSEEILEQQSEDEELEEATKAAVKSSGRKIKEQDDEEEEEEEESDDKEKEVDEKYEDEEDEEEVEEAYTVPKTKAGMVKAIYDSLNSMKKAELSDSFAKILGSTLVEEDEEEDDDEEKEKAAPFESKKLKKEDLSIDVKEDIDAILSGEDLSEEFKSKASTIFEAAVSAKVISAVNERIETFEDDYHKSLNEAKEEHKVAVTEKVDSYLNYVVEEWVKENELALEKGIRSELVEDFMTGLKNLFQEHYIDIPEEKVDLVDDLFEKVEELEKQLDETVNHNVEIKKELSQFQKEETLREVSEDLADTEKEKLEKLSEGVDYEDSEQYKEKLVVIKENYFPKTSETAQSLTEDVQNTEADVEVEKTDPSMAIYTKHLSKHGTN